MNDLALHYLAKMKILVVRDIEREDVEFISRVCLLALFLLNAHFLLTVSRVSSNSKFGSLSTRAPWLCAAGGGGVHWHQ